MLSTLTARGFGVGVGVPTKATACGAEISNITLLVVFKANKSLTDVSAVFSTIRFSAEAPAKRREELKSWAYR